MTTQNDNEETQTVTALSTPATTSPCGSTNCECCEQLGTFNGLLNNGQTVTVTFTGSVTFNLGETVEVYQDFENDYHVN